MRILIWIRGQILLGSDTLTLIQAEQAKQDSNQLTQYTPINEEKHKEVDRKHKLNSARVYFYQVSSI